LILAIDQGTTGTTCSVFDERGRPAGRAYREFQQYFPRPGGWSTMPVRSGT
jgi:glycerol kinase